MKIRQKKAVLFVCFLAILTGLWIGFQSILEKPKESSWNTKGIKRVVDTTDYYDVLLMGTSMAVTNISAEELYLQYGIASCSMGSPEQFVFLTYDLLEEALEHQNPKAVIFDVQALFYTEESQAERIEYDKDYYVFDILDDLKSVTRRYEAISQVQELVPSVTYKDYFFEMFRIHSNWENLTSQHFREELCNDIILGSRSLTAVWENVDDAGYVSLEDNTCDMVDIPQLNKNYFGKMVSLCREKGIDIILVKGYGSKYWDWGQYNACVNLANEFDLPYFDLAVHEEEIGFDWLTDSHDGRHQNVIGAKKWTDFLGDYLVSNYTFEDRREDPRYKEFEESRQKYEDVLGAVSDKNELLQSTDLNLYLDTLRSLDKNGITIFVSTKGDAFAHLTEEYREGLNALGFHLSSTKEDAYYGVLDDGQVIAEAGGAEEDEVAGKLNDGSVFTVISESADAVVDASIVINNEEQIQGGQGINIVVYDKDADLVLSSVYFDTSIEENPTTTRINADGNIQYEVGENYWR